MDCRLPPPRLVEALAGVNRRAERGDYDGKDVREYGERRGSRTITSPETMARRNCQHSGRMGQRPAAQKA